jgi:hypothetical protein
MPLRTTGAVESTIFNVSTAGRRTPRGSTASSMMTPKLFLDYVIIPSNFGIETHWPGNILSNMKWR